MKILYIDMDGVIADFDAAIHKHKPGIELANYKNADIVDAICEDNPTIFESLPEIENAIETVKRLMTHFDVYFLTTPM